MAAVVETRGKTSPALQQDFKSRERLHDFYTRAPDALRLLHGADEKAKRQHLNDIAVHLFKF